MAEEAIFSFILEGLKLVIQEAQFLHGVEDQVENLRQQLNQLHWFLKDTSSASEDGQKRVREWVLLVRDLSYQAENLVESYAFKVASHHRRSGSGIKRKIKRFAGIFNECYNRHQIGSDIETLMSKITKFTTNFNEYGIRQILENKDDNEATRRSRWRKTYSTTTDEDELFVGSDDAINILVEKLVSDQYRTVSLYGMGGLGKTTLARKLYNHPTVRRHFVGFSWVSISQQWQKDDILRGILIKLLPDGKRDDISKWRDEELVRELSQFLRITNCLVVLDDIWSIKAWESIEAAISIRENGSKVMITTRMIEVAKLLDGHTYLHNPQFLTGDESWELLCKKALRGQDSQEIMKFEGIGKEMISHCGGLPLAVMALGGILSSRHSYDEWQNVHNNINSYLRNDGRLNVHGILSLSYDDLPFQLKPCFLYLSHYPEDEEIKVETLYQYWMAEGMVSRDDRLGSNDTMMDVAEHYLTELADRSLVFAEKEEGYSLRMYKSCRLHDLVRDVCISKAKEENFFESIDYRYINNDVVEASLASTRNTSRLSIYLPGEDEEKIFVPLVDAVNRNLRSFTLVLNTYSERRTSFSITRLGEFVMLRRLSVQRKKGLDYAHMELPTSIGKLVHLRYFNIFGYILLVPSSLGKLKQLQTLDFHGCEVKRAGMPNVLRKMARLNHLYLPDLDDPSYKIRNLRLDGLNKLEILEGFDSNSCNVNDILTLTNLRKLEAYLSFAKVEEFMEHVRKLTNLRFLDLSIIGESSSSKEVVSIGIINNIISYSYLVHLVIYNCKISEFPRYEWGFCQKLQSLKLFENDIEEDPLSMFGRLPELRSLQLWERSFVGKEMSCHASDFPQLRELHLRGLENLEMLEIEAGAMPNLSQLTIWGCSRLNTIPSGLRFITSLKRFYAFDMSEEFKQSVELDLFDEISHIQTITIDL